MKTAKDNCLWQQTMSTINGCQVKRQRDPIITGWPFLHSIEGCQLQDGKFLGAGAWRGWNFTERGFLFFFCLVSVLRGTLFYLLGIFISHFSDSCHPKWLAWTERKKKTAVSLFRERTLKVSIWFRHSTHQILGSKLANQICNGLELTMLHCQKSTQLEGRFCLNLWWFCHSIPYGNSPSKNRGLLLLLWIS